MQQVEAAQRAEPVSVAEVMLKAAALSAFMAVMLKRKVLMVQQASVAEVEPMVQM
jgi:hypothetical protein